MGFVRKVLGIVTMQLIGSFIIIISASIRPSSKSIDNCYIYNYGVVCLNPFAMFCVSLPCQITSVIVYLISLIALLVSRNLRHSVPANYILLTLFTISLGFIFAGLTAWITPASVILSIGVLVATLLGLFGSALLIKNKAAALKFVLVGILAACILQVFICFTLIWSNYYYSDNYYWIMYCALGVLIASGLIYLDLYIIMLAGKYAMDEYIYCAILLYVDIMRLLLYILMIFGKGKK